LKPHNVLISFTFFKAVFGRTRPGWSAKNRNFLPAAGALSERIQGQIFSQARALRFAAAHTHLDRAIAEPAEGNSPAPRRFATT
jgi:hypothetical protein